MRIRTIIHAAALAVSLAGFGGAAFAQDAELDAPVPDSAAVAPVAPWYQSFTLNGNRFDLSGLPTDRTASSVDFNAGANWGLSLGFESASTPSTRSESVDGLSAGAFFKVTPRMRVGGELGYRAQAGDPSTLRPAGEPGSSQVKLESAFRF